MLLLLLLFGCLKSKLTDADNVSADGDTADVAASVDAVADAVTDALIHAADAAVAVLSLLPLLWWCCHCCCCC